MGKSLFPIIPNFVVDVFATEQLAVSTWEHRQKLPFNDLKNIFVYRHRKVYCIRYFWLECM